MIDRVHPDPDQVTAWRRRGRTDPPAEGLPCDDPSWSLRQLVIAGGAGVVGMFIAVQTIGFIAASTDTVNNLWLAGAPGLTMACTVFGIMFGHDHSGGTNSLPITQFSRRLPFVVIGAVLGALTIYACHVQLVAVWGHRDFWTLFFDPGSVPALTSIRHSGAHPQASEESVGLGSSLFMVLAGGWMTNRLLKSAA